MQYPGGKGGAGVVQRIINLMPAHDVYIEPFVGGGTVFRTKKPAPVTVIIDIDVRALDKLDKHITPTVNAVNGDAISWMHEYAWSGSEFVFCDPPYVHASRTKKKIYNHEMTDQQHIELLSLLLTIPAAVMLAGYRNDIYDFMLKDWFRIDYEAMTRGGLKTESLWLNYDPPTVPAELTYLGKNFRERERIKRKKQRWAKKLEAMPLAEQHAIMEVLTDLLKNRQNDS